MGERSDAGRRTTGRRKQARPRGSLDRDRILGAAIGLSESRGAKALTMRALAAELDADPMALYHYFASKEELLTAMAAKLLESLGAYLARPSEAGAGEQLVVMGMEYLAFAHDKPHHFALLYDNLPAGESSWDEFMRSAWPLQLVRDAVARGVRAGEFVERPGRSIDEMSYGIWSLVHGVAVLRRSRLRRVRGDYQQIHRHLLMNYVASLAT